ncbi:nucleolar protein [Batrachochytrium dendrobatidis]
MKSKDENIKPATKMSSKKITKSAVKTKPAATPTIAKTRSASKKTAKSTKTLPEPTESDSLEEQDDGIKVVMPDELSDAEEDDVQTLFEKNDDSAKDVDSDADIIKGIDSSDDQDSSDDEYRGKKGMHTSNGKTESISKKRSDVAGSEKTEFQNGENLVLLEPSDLSTLKTATKKVKGVPKTTPGVVYLGHIPHGFYEAEMLSYFSQFGEVTRLRLSRNKKTGHSKHYAFVEFKDIEVAKIVADTMDNYLMFNRMLKCKVVSADKLHADTFKGCDRKFRVIPWNKLQRDRQNKPKTAEEWDTIQTKLEKRDSKKRKQLEELGIDYEFPGYAGAAAERKAKLAASAEKTLKKSKKASEDK